MELFDNRFKSAINLCMLFCMPCIFGDEYLGIFVMTSNLIRHFLPVYHMAPWRNLT